MPTLTWIGKKAVENHHRQVPFHLLREVPELSFGAPGSGNLIVEGDNLLALKALLPYYAGQVKCIYIDPPYNTGNEGWTYNDNVTSAEIREWLGKVVGREGDDLTRHDKWLCMMYPRLCILKQFLSSNGVIAVSIDDNELNNLGMLLDEIFGQKNRLACAPWLAEPSGGKEKTGLRGGHEYIFVYHNGDDQDISREIRSTGKLDLQDEKGKYRKGRELRKWGGISLRIDRPGQWYPLLTPEGIEVWPIRNDGKEGHWRWGKEQKMKSIVEDPKNAHWELRPFDEGVVWKGQKERWVPHEKIRDVSKSIGWSTWLDSFGFNSDATRELKGIFGSKPFDTPKPSALVRWLISLHSDESCLVLDSFAGSGTTAQATLMLNEEDGGNRRFILVEMDQKIAREITAERVKRVAEGYKNAKGEKVTGLGGAFTFAVLGDAMFDEMGKIRPTVNFIDLARHVYFTETGVPAADEPTSKSPLIGEFNGKAIYLLYNGILKDKSPNGGNVLTTSVLTALPKHEGPKVVYGTSCRISKDRLRKEGIEFKQLPYKLRVGVL